MSINSSAEAGQAAWAAPWLEGKVVLVTGGTGGIGGAFAQAFCDAGAQVTVTGATDAEIADAQSRPEMTGITLRRLDVCDTDGVRAFVSGFDRMDVVVNCAGIIRRGEELASEVFQRVIDINLTGTMRICEAAAPVLEKTGGSIINIASMLSYFGGGLVPGYSASKGGVAQLTKSLAIAWAPRGIRVNAIAPGWIATPLTRALQDDPARSGPILARTPMARWGRPSDLGGLALFLTSPHAGFMTGTIIPVDGGYSIT